ncbi:DUF6328 family protein [Micromonospora echinaurantiaca]|uniref:DUF6328 family protein n=1 Tax=Micromonospora echinaurantiaca TaxID=47857 RepID=UPI002F907FDB
MLRCCPPPPRPRPIIAPVALHSALFRRGRKSELVRYAHRVSSGALGFMLIAMASAVLLITDYVLSRGVALLLSAITTLVFLLLWVGLPLTRRDWGRASDRTRAWREALPRLRHAYAAWLAIDNVPITLVRRALGHEQASSNRLYAQSAWPCRSAGGSPRRRAGARPRRLTFRTDPHRGSRCVLAASAAPCRRRPLARRRRPRRHRVTRHPTPPTASYGRSRWAGRRPRRRAQVTSKDRPSTGPPTHGMSTFSHIHRSSDGCPDDQAISTVSAARWLPPPPSSLIPGSSRKPPGRPVI